MTGTASVTVLPPVAVIDTPSSNVTITKGESVSFTGTGTDPGNLSLTYRWDFGDPNIADSTAQDPGKVVFNNPGTYTVTFTVTNSKGLSHSDTCIVTVKDSTVTNPPALISKTGWKLVYVDSEETVAQDGRAINAFDGQAATFWHTEWKNSEPAHPHEIQIDLGATYELVSFSYLPRQDRTNGRIKDYAFYVSNDPKNWGNAVASGEFANTSAEKTVTFNSKAVGRFIRLVALSEVNGNPWTSAVEISVTGTAFTMSSSASLPEENIDSTTDIIEWGEVVVDHNWQRVYFEKSFINPIVVAKPASLNDPDPAVVRIGKIDETGFDIRIQEWDYLDGVHGFENVSYMVVEKGSYILPGNVKMEAGTFEAGDKNFSFNPFAESFSQIPVVIASVTSVERQNAVDGRIGNVSTNGFDYCLQEQELNDQIDNGTETVSFIAIECFSGVLNELTIEVGTTGTLVNHDFHDIVFTENFLTVPHFLADMQTANELDSSNLRYSTIDDSAVEMQISEEESMDMEIFHSNENIGYIVISK